MNNLNLNLWTKTNKPTYDMKKIVLLLGLCVTFFACDVNRFAAKELITESLMKEFDDDFKIKKIKVEKASADNSNSNNSLISEASMWNLALYYSSIELLFVESGDFNEGDKVKFVRAYFFDINYDEKPIEISMMETYDAKIKKKGESTWEDIN